MGRKVKLQDTGLFGDSSVNYKAENGKYYTSKEVYENTKQNQVYRNKCIDTLVDLLSLENVPTFLLKKLKDYKDFGVVYRFLVDKSDVIRSCIHSKSFSSEVNLISYVMAIVSNNYSDYVKLVKAEKKQEKVATEINDDIDISINRAVVNKNISKWLGDDE